MRILFLALDVTLDTPRGDAVHVCELARYLSRRGNQVHLVTATRQGRVPDLGSGVTHDTRPDASDIATVRTCLEAARRTNADVVYERRLSPKIAFGVSRLSSLPFVVEVNGIEEEAELQGRTNRSPLRPVKVRLRRQMYRRVAAVVAVSERLATSVRAANDLPPEKVLVVPNGVDLERFAVGDSAVAQRRVGLSAAPWIVFVGNLVLWQGVETLIKAMPLMAAEHSVARLLAVGNGELRSRLEALTSELGVSDRVTFTGSVTHQLVPDYIRAATVCVAPFTRERNDQIGLSPLKIYEYMACGRPVVASRVPGVAEILEKSGAGLLVSPDNPEELARAAARLIGEPSVAREMGLRGRDFAERECSWARTAECVEGVLSRAARGP